MFKKHRHIFLKEIFLNSVKDIFLTLKLSFIDFIKIISSSSNFLNIGPDLLCRLNNAQMMKFLNHKIKNNKVLVTDPIYPHGEVLPGIIKYLSDLGYDSEVLILNSKNDEKPLSMFKNIKVFSVSENQYFKILQSKKLDEYKHVIITSSRIYNGFSSNKFMFDYFKNCKIKNASFIEHHLQLPNQKEKQEYKFAGLPVYSNNFNLKMINSHYFGDYKISPKCKGNANGKVKFIVVGELIKSKKDPDILLNACKVLVEKGIENFEVKVIGSRQWFEITNKELLNKIIKVGRVTYDKLYELVGESDYILALLDPNNGSHKRYITNATSGIYQLSYGFLKPLIINEIYAYPHKLNEENSIIYSENNLAEAMEFAMNETQESYITRVKNLSILEKNIYNESLKNLKELLNEKS